MQYACRKSLADKRPRVRGRFARNDESTEHPSHGNGHKLEDDDEVSRTNSIQVPVSSFCLEMGEWTPVQYTILSASERLCMPPVAVVAVQLLFYHL